MDFGVEPTTVYIGEKETSEIDPNSPENPSSVVNTLNDPLLSKILGIESKKFDKIEEKYYVDKVNPSPDTLEASQWGSPIPIDNLVLGTGTIIQGKRVGRTIGIPTANLDFGPDKIEKYELIPGVYYGSCYLLDHNLPAKLEYLGG